MIVIIDYKVGNRQSVKNVLDQIGVESIISDSPEAIRKADRLILPGQGAFGPLMENLRKNELEEPLKQFIAQGKPFLGICLGMQALFEESEESKCTKGLGILKGKVVRFKSGKIPQIGWNEIIPNTAFGIQKGYAYFANSYVAIPQDPTTIAAQSEYGEPFVVAVKKNNITGVQFHPEKSGIYGINFLRMWLKC